MSGFWCLQGCNQHKCGRNRTEAQDDQQDDCAGAGEIAFEVFLPGAVFAEPIRNFPAAQDDQNHSRNRECQNDGPDDKVCRILRERAKQPIEHIGHDQIIDHVQHHGPEDIILCRHIAQHETDRKGIRPLDQISMK